MVQDEVVYSVQGRDINSPVINLEIEGEKLKVFIDTGSKVSLVSEAMVKSFKDVEIKTCNTRITS